MKEECLQGFGVSAQPNGNLINLPMFGKVKLILHRPLPDGFKIKTASLTKKSDGYYVTLSWKTKRFQKLSQISNPIKLLELMLA